MALVRISLADLRRFVRMRDGELEARLAALGIPLEKLEGDEAAIEITPNRPDWLSVEGVARSLASFESGKPKKYSAQLSEVEWIIDHSVKPVRPFLGSAIVRGVKMDDALVASMMQLQEKLHDTLGRGRKKLAIGLHDASSVEPPFIYVAVPRNGVRFVPLNGGSPQTCEQILTGHEKGIAFAHLVGSLCPLIADRNGEVLSFPPIINSERTRVTSSATDIIIDCTGTSEHAVSSAVQIVAAALADRGGTAYSVKINHKQYPLFAPREMPLPAAEASKLLGIRLTDKDVALHLAKMGYIVSGKRVQVPSFRADVMHSVDLIEDIAISCGYNNFKPTLPQFTSIGASDSSGLPLHSALLGLGYFEAQSWLLTNSKTTAASQFPDAAGLVVENPLTAEFTALRPALYPNHLQIFAQSRAEAMPQYVYEIGPVFLDGKESVSLAACACHPKAGWAEVKSHLSGFGASIGVSFDFQAASRQGFIDGRFAEILHSDQKIGIAGEINPDVLVAFGIEQPVSLFEISVASLKK